MELERYRDVSPFIAALPAPEVRFLESAGEPATFYSGDKLCTAGQSADRFHLITSGRVTIETRGPSGEAIVVDSLGVGDLVGVSWFFPPYQWRWDVRAATDVMTVAFDAAVVRKEAGMDGRLRQALLTRFVDELNHRLEAARRLLAGQG
jgi:CRP/FNR family cyclic AMP-dependent transcriptional regulator